MAMRAVRLYFNRDDFNVNGDNWLDNDEGYSHGMLLDSAYFL